MPEQYIVRGTVTSPNEASRRGTKVVALDRDLPSRERRGGAEPQVLGEAFADAEGRFEIAYTLEQFAAGDTSVQAGRPRQANADLSFRVFDRAGQEQAIRSIRAPDREFRGNEIIFNAPTTIEVGIVIEARTDGNDSEYERLLATIGPVIADLPVEMLTDEDMAFLANELDLERQGEVRQHVDWLRWSAALAQEARLAAAAFYGWARTEVPPDQWARLDGYDDPQRRADAMTKLLDQLAATDRQTLTAHLVRAVEDRIIPAIFLDRAGAIATAIARRSLTEMTVRLRLIDGAAQEALAGYTVTTFEAAIGGRGLGSDLTDAAGEFDVTFHADRRMQDSGQTLRLRITGPDLPEPIEMQQRVVAAEGAVVVVAVPMPARGRTLRQWQAEGHLDVPEDVVQVLQQRHGIQTLADIRRRGGLTRIAAIREIDAGMTRRLDALADLERLTADPNEMAIMLAHEYDSVAAIADTPRGEFLAAFASERTPRAGPAAIGIRRAAELHVMARAQSDLLHQLFAGLAVDFSNGIQPATGVTTGDYFPPFPPEGDNG